MYKSILCLGIIAIEIATIAAPIHAESIRNGKYQAKYGDNIGIKIEKNKYSVFYDDTAPDPAVLIPKGGFKYIKSGVFYNNKDKKYYCSIDSLPKKISKSVAKEPVCTRTGWTKPI